MKTSHICCLLCARYSLYALIKTVATIATFQPGLGLHEYNFPLIAFASTVSPQKPHENNSRLDHYEAQAFYCLCILLHI